MCLIVLRTLMIIARIPITTVLTFHHEKNESEHQERIEKREALRLREIEDALKKREKRKTTSNGEPNNQRNISSLV